MKTIYKWLLRIVPVLTAFVIFVSILSPSASAEVLDPYDYATVEVDGNNDLLSIAFPDTLSEWIEFDVGTSPAVSIQRVKGNMLYSVMDQHDLQNRTFQYYPLGFGNYISTEGIPIDSTMDISGSVLFDYVDPQATGFYFTLNYYLRLRLYDDDGNMIDNIIVESKHTQVFSDYEEYLLNINVSNYSVGEIVKASYFDYYFVIGTSNEVDVDAVGIGVEAHSDFTLDMSISSWYKEQQLLDENNKLLGEVKNQLQEQGKTMEEVVDQQQQTNDKLDQIIDGTVAPEKPSDSGTVDNIGSIEGDLMDDMSDNYGEVADIMDTAINLFATYGGAFLAVAHLVGRFMDLPFINDLVMISFALGIFASLLGVGMSYVSFKNDKGEASKNKGKEE